MDSSKVPIGARFTRMLAYLAEILATSLKPWTQLALCVGLFGLSSTVIAQETTTVLETLTLSNTGEGRLTYNNLSVSQSSEPTMAPNERPVIDTGVDYNHDDLVDNRWINVGEIAGNGIDDDGNGFVDDVYGYDFAYNDGDPMDVQSHGTHVSGTIGGVGNNSIGVAGVSHAVRIMAVKFLDDSGSGWTDDAIDAIIYAVDNGAQILSNSWGAVVFLRG